MTDVTERASGRGSNGKRGARMPRDERRAQLLEAASEVFVTRVTTRPAWTRSPSVPE